MFFLPYFILFSIFNIWNPCRNPASLWHLQAEVWSGVLKVQRSPGVTALSSPALWTSAPLQAVSFSSSRAPTSHTSRQLSTTRLPLVSLQLSMDTRATTAVCMKQQQCCQGNSPLWRQNRFICEPEGHYRPYLHCHMLMLKSLAVFVVIHLYHPSCSHQQGSPFRDRAPHFWTGPICLVLV